MWRLLRQHWLLLVPLFTLLTASGGMAQGQLILVQPLNNEVRSAVDSVSAQCQRSADGRRLTCDFVQVMVRLQTTPEESERKVRDELSKMTEKDWKDVAAAVKDENCSAAKQKELREAVAKQQLSEKERKYFEGMFERHSRLCAQPTRSNVEELLRFMAEKDSKTCRIWANPYKETFEWQPQGKWVSNRGPGGICGVIYVSTLTAEDKDREMPALWRYETRKIVTSKEAGGQLCPVDEQPIRYSWKAPSKALTCEFIEFGP
jgi:hypothetical protein